MTMLLMKELNKDIKLKKKLIKKTENVVTRK